MHLAKASLLIVLLVIPNTVWHDWKNSTNPALQAMLKTAALAEMMPRTAEHDKITSDAEIRTILAGARMNATDSVSDLDYPVRPTNLQDTLIKAGWHVDIQSDPVEYITQEISNPKVNRFILRTINNPLNSQASADSISFWMKKIQNSNQSSELIVVSGCPSSQEYSNHERLCPIAIWYPSQSSSNTLTSDSTRTEGLVTNTDLAPTIAGLVGVHLTGPSYGSAIHSKSSPAPDTFNRLSYLANKAQNQEIGQEDVPFFAIETSCLILLTVLGWRSKNRIVSRFISFLIPAMLLLILTCLLTSGLVSVVMTVLLLLIVLAIPAASRDRSTIEFYIVQSLLFTLLSLDSIFNHSLLSARSLMGYSFQEGARYYGLGNEAMGAMIGIAAVITSFIRNNSKQNFIIGAIIWILLITVFALPDVGAKAGGVLVGGISFGLYLAQHRLCQTDTASKLLVISGMFAGLLGGLAILYIASHLFGTSHVSQTLGQAHQFGETTIRSVVYRKLAMDFKLMFHSTWMLVLIASLTVQYSAIRSQITNETISKAKTIWQIGLVSTFACLFLNDAGVVAAALCSIFPLVSLMGYAQPLNSAYRQIYPSQGTKPEQQSG